MEVYLINAENAIRRNSMGREYKKGYKTREMRRRADQTKRRVRSVAYAATAVPVLGLSAYLLIAAFTRPGPPPIAGNVIDIAANMGGFDRSEIRLKLGEPVTIRLTSKDNQHHTDGGGKHQWAVDELSLNVIAQPLSSNYVTFTPTEPGTFGFYCDVCCGGRANPTMQGTLIIEA
jgi:heme/copper-type cytochrome/quinol oxidase subunit 2